MAARLNPNEIAPELIRPMRELQRVLEASSLEPSLIELVKIRASQINGCTFCLHMHTKDARARGEREERLYLLDAWHESALYTERERAALGWTEALTLVARSRAPDSDYAALEPWFTREEIVALTFLIATINAWNRIAIGFRSAHPAEAALAA